MNKHAHVLGTASVAVLILAMGGMTPAEAQVAPKDSSSVETVTVTGSRVKENIQTVSAAISALSADQLESKNVLQVADLQYATPSLSITDAGLSQNVNIRGIGLSSGSPAVSPGVPIYLDGLVQPPIAFANGFYDIQDVEVYRGPQGTFAGASSTGGAVFVNSNSPTLDKVGGSIEAWGGDYWDAGLRGAVNVPITDDFAFRAAFNLERRDSFYTNLGSALTPTGAQFNTPGKLNEQDVRLGFFWQPTDNLSILLKIAGSDKSTDGYVAIPRTGTPNAVYAPTGKRQISYDTQEQNNERTIRNGLDIKYVLPNGITLRSVTGYQENVVWDIYDTDATPEPSVKSWETQDVIERPFSQEFNIVSPDNGKLKWILGAFYYNDMTKVGLEIGLAPPNAPGHLPIVIYQHKTTEAVFGRVQYNVTDDLQLEVGGRWEHDWAKLRQISDLYLPVGPGGMLINLSHTDGSGTWSGDMWTGKVAANYTLDDQNFLYAFVSKGSKVGGASIGYTFDPETVWDYEAGWKSMLFDERLVVQLSGFYSQYSSFQVDGLNPANGLSSTFNTKDATMDGVELQLFGNFGQFRFDMGGAWVQTSVGAVTLVNTNLLPFSTSTRGPQCAAGVPSNPPTCFNYTPYEVSVDGRRNPYAPTWTFNFGAEYAFNMGPDTTLTPRVDYSYQGSQWTTLWQTYPSDWMPGHGLWNARLTLNHKDWSLSAYATNLLDTTYATGQFLNTMYQGPPRQFGARLSYRF
jgi:iron complex outermembrane recepter protein